MKSPAEIIAGIYGTGLAFAITKALAEAGYAVVPRDATDAALSAGLQASLDMMREHGVDGLSPFADYPPPIEVCRRVYRAMLEAAPDAGGGNG